MLTPAEEQARAFNDQVRAAAATMAPIYTMAPEAIRRRRWEGGGVMPPPTLLDHAEEIEIPNGDHSLTLRILTPPKVEGVLLYIHGGGWVIGGAREQDPQLWEIATSANLAVVAVEYRLAPEHPYPVPIEDCDAAALWLIENAKERFGSSRLLISGESAGAHLAVMTLLRLRDRHGVTGAFAGADLVYGVFDLSMTPSQREWGEEIMVLSTPTMQWFYDNFTPGLTLEERQSPEISPLYADLHDLPPALFTVGGADMLLDDSLLMAKRWSGAGLTSDLRVYPEGCHGFVMFPLALGSEANAHRYAFLREAGQTG